MRGREGEYVWADRLGAPWGLVQRCPAIVVGRRVVITAFDSGPPRVADEEAKRGWAQAGSTIVTARIESYEDIVGALSDEYSEAWVFDADAPVPDFSGWNDLAGHEVITLSNPVDELPYPPPTWDTSVVDDQRAWLTARQAELRAGLTRFRPLTFLRDDLIVTRDPAAIAALDDVFVEAGRCTCSALGRQAWVKPSVTLFTAPFDLLDRAGEDGATLYRCRTCGAYWLVDHNRGNAFAVRLTDARRWKEIDRWPAKRALIVASHGGEQDRRCIWAGCPHRALRESALCAEHLATD